MESFSQGITGENRSSDGCLCAQVMQCPNCDGQGEESTPCNTCGGDGRVRNSKKISLRVPAGAASAPPSPQFLGSQNGSPFALPVHALRCAPYEAEQTGVA